VREGGEWVDRARFPIGRPGWRLLEVGPVGLYQPDVGLRRDTLKATAVARVPRERPVSITVKSTGTTMVFDGTRKAAARRLSPSAAGGSSRRTTGTRVSLRLVIYARQ
jgi:hypothetical protein